MWWKRLEQQAVELRELPSRREKDLTATVDSQATLLGAVSVGPYSRVCAGAYIVGPVRIGARCLIGNNVMIRGPLTIGDDALIGFSVEIKNAIIGNGVKIGPMSFVADAVIDDEVYFGAMVRISNHRLDQSTVKSEHEGVLVDTGQEKLGAYIGARASLGIQVIVYPGRIVAPGSIFGPRINIEKNLPPGRYMLKQTLEVADLT